MKVTIEKLCPVCRKPAIVEVEEDDWDAYCTPRQFGGKLAQEAFPYLAPDEREMIISGTHPECWEKLFGPHP